MSQVTNPNAKPAQVSEAELLKAAMDKIAALEAQISAQSSGTLTFKVSDKGAVSCYGLGRFPATFYKSQWERLLANADKLRAFIKANEASLTVKGQNVAG
jgi:hypothetical protein